MKYGSTGGSSLSSKKVGEFYGQEATFFDKTDKRYEEDLKANQLGALGRYIRHERRHIRSSTDEEK
jgi:hypothetical protein